MFIHTSFTMTDKVAVTCLFPSCNAVEDNAFLRKILHGLFGGVGYLILLYP
jgi:hypothetical protein